MASVCQNALSQNVSVTKHDLVFSAIRGSTSKTDTVRIVSSQKRNIGRLKIEGEHASFFEIVSQPISGTVGKPVDIVVQFQPSDTFVGIARAMLVIPGFKKSVTLTGLSTRGLEGENEAPLALIVEALGYSIDLGWETLANHCRSELQGEELEPALFRKAKEGKVEMIPVARYSPDFPVNFGYYTNFKNGPSQHQAGILSEAKDFPEHQMLYPSIDVGSASFDPGEDIFGVYTISPEHTIYSEDVWNILFYPRHVAHGVRVFPMHNRKGELMEDNFLICMEEASNGDYNDYVFILKNVRPVYLKDKFTSLLNGQNLQGWYTWLETKGKNNDPEQIFTIEADGILHDQGKELGYLMTEKAFGNFHFALEFKWGEKRWPPRENDKRDSGICYNIPEGESDSIWPPSIECQIQEGDVGDFWLLGYSTIQVDDKQNPPLRHSRVVKRKDAEKPYGEWNKVEVISFNGKCVHIVNGVVVNYGDNASLVEGTILLQSEYAEIYYRNVEIREF